MYQPRQLSATATAATESGAANNRSFGFAMGYGVKTPPNLSVVFADSDVAGPRTSGGGAGYWFEEKPFVGPTFQTVNFWVRESETKRTAG